MISAQKVLVLSLLLFLGSIDIAFATTVSPSTGGSLSEGIISGAATDERVYLYDYDCGTFSACAALSPSAICGFDGASNEGYPFNGNTVASIYGYIRGTPTAPAAGCVTPDTDAHTWYIFTLNGAQTAWADTDTFVTTGVPPAPTSTAQSVDNFGENLFFGIILMFVGFMFPIKAGQYIDSRGTM